MSIATKLTYLNTTKGKIKDSINLTGANIGSNDTFRSYAVKLRDGLLNVLNNGTIVLYNNFPKVSGTGSNISLSNTLEAPMFMNKFDGDTFQQTYSGKNLLPINQIQSQTINGITITNLSDGTIKINGTTTSTTRIDVSYTKSLIANTTYKFINSYTRNNSNANVNIQDANNSVIGSITLNNTNSTFTPNSDVEITKMRLYIDSSQTFDNYILKVMLIKSTETETYEPYTNGASPNPDYPQEIQSVEGIQNVEISGKNLCNVEFENGTYDGAGYPVSSNIRLRTKTPIYLKTGTYTISAVNTLQTHILISDSGTSGNYANLFAGFKDLPFTFTITSDKYVLIVLDDISATNIQLESGSTATEYVPYKTPQNYEVNLEGKNLLPITSQDFTINNINFKAQNGKILINGTSSVAIFGGSFRNSNMFPIILEAGTYTISRESVGSLSFGLIDDSGNTYGQLTSSSTVLNISFTINEKKTYYLYFYVPANKTIDNEIFTIQIEKGSTATSYVPYREPIELCKIGTYQDYIYKNGENWYMYKEIAKIELLSTLNWFRDKEKPNSWRFYSQSNVIPNSHNNEAMSNYFKGDTIANVNNIDSQAITTINNNQIALRINKSIAPTVDDLKTWLSNNEVYDYTILTTPTTEQITDTYLISQLNALYNAKSKNGQTNISVSGNLPMILEVSALKDEI